MIVFDSSAVIDFLRGGLKVRSIVEQTEQKGEVVNVTVVSQYELLAPVYHKQLRDEERNVRSFLRRAKLLNLDADSAEEASRIMGALFRLGKPVNALDTLIAGIAIANGAESIATRDRDFVIISKVAEIAILLIP